MGQTGAPELLRVGVELPAGLEGSRHVLAVLRVAGAEHDVGELEDPLVVGCGDTHHVADDPEGEGGGHL